MKNLNILAIILTTALLLFCLTGCEELLTNDLIPNGNNPSLVGGWIATEMTKNGTPVNPADLPMVFVLLTADGGGFSIFDVEGDFLTWSTNETHLFTKTGSYSDTSSYIVQDISTIIITSYERNGATVDTVVYKLVRWNPGAASQPSALVGSWTVVERVVDGVPEQITGTIKSVLRVDGYGYSIMNDGVKEEWYPGTWWTRGDSLDWATKPAEVIPSHYRISNDTLITTYRDGNKLVVEKLKKQGSGGGGGGGGYSKNPALVGGWKATGMIENGTPKFDFPDIFSFLKADGSGFSVVDDEGELVTWYSSATHLFYQTDRIDSMAYTVKNSTTIEVTRREWDSDKGAYDTEVVTLTLIKPDYNTQTASLVGKWNLIERRINGTVNNPAMMGFMSNYAEGYGLSAEHTNDGEEWYPYLWWTSGATFVSKMVHGGDIYNADYTVSGGILTITYSYDGDTYVDKYQKE